MFERRSSRKMRSLLPLYVNGALRPRQRRAVEAWLRRRPEAQAELAAWQAIGAAIAGQPREAPSPDMQARLMARVRAQARPRVAVERRLVWAWGAAIALAVSVLLWALVQPGMLVQWSVENGNPVAFRLYRAPAGSDELRLVETLPARPDARQYAYVDALLWPWQTYVYRVEGVEPSGRATLSQPVAASARGALPDLAAILVASLGVGGLAALLAQRWVYGGQRAPSRWAA